MLWPRVDHFLKVVKSMLCTPGVALATMSKSVLTADLIIHIRIENNVALQKEFTGMYWSAVADLSACSDEDEEFVSGQGSGSQAIIGMFALGVVYGARIPK